MTDVKKLLDIMARLRDPNGGCPWDLEQNFDTIAPYTIEEAYEVADAIDRKDMEGLRGELGDLLLQVVFHAQMAQESGHFDFGGVVDAICAKMISRHPHVFGDEKVADADEQTRKWEEHKRRERGADADASALAGIAKGIPEWQRALKLQQRAATVGFDWPDANPVFDKLHEELDEVRAELADPERNHERLTDEIGDVLFVCVNLARHARVDTGAALRAANRKFERRFRQMERDAAAEGKRLVDLPLAEQDDYWNRAKRQERS